MAPSELIQHAVYDSGATGAIGTTCGVMHENLPKLTALHWTSKETILTEKRVIIAGQPTCNAFTEYYWSAHKDSVSNFSVLKPTETEVVKLFR
jgi:hypothetical protein